VGCLLSPEEKRSRELDNQLDQSGKQYQKEIKLLLLGTGESGKSTVFKQFKILQINGGFSKEELLDVKEIIFENCITQMRVLINACNTLRISLSKEENQKHAQTVTSDTSWSPGVAEAIASLWADDGIQSAYSQRGNGSFTLNDSASYMYQHLDRFSKPDYFPTQEDALRARQRSVGINEATFSFAGLKFRVVDVGGQRTERKKWIHCFDNVTAVVFCTAINEYDMYLREDKTQNRLKESLLLFDEVCNCPPLRQTAFILFLNKIDLFKEKIAKVDLKQWFPNYTGGLNYDKALNFLEDKFKELNTSPHTIFCHQTCAVDTENMRVVFNFVRETIMKRVLNSIF